MNRRDAAPLLVSAFLIFVPWSPALPARPMQSRDGAAQSADARLLAFTEADALRLKSADGSAERGRAAAAAATLAGAHAWQLHAQKCGTDAAVWFDREQQLHAESYRIWSPILDRDYQRMSEQAARRPSADDTAAWRALWSTALEVIATAQDAQRTDGASTPWPRPPALSSPMSEEELHAATLTVATALRANRTSAMIEARKRNDLVRAIAVATAQVQDSRAALKVVAPTDLAGEAAARAHAALAGDLETLADMAQDQGHFDEAERHLEEALELRRQIPEEQPNRRLGESLGRLGRLYRDTGRLTEARIAFESALADAEPRSRRTGDGSADALILALLDNPADLSRDLGVLLESQGQYAAATERYRIAEQQANHARSLLSGAPQLSQFEGAYALIALRMRTLVPLLRARTGDIESARGELRQLREELLAGGDSGRSIAAITARVAQLDLSLGNVESATESFEAAFGYFSRAGDIDGTIYAELALATALSRAGKAVQAGARADAAYLMAESSGRPTWRARAAIVSARQRLERGVSDGVDDRIAVIRNGAPILSVEDRAAGLVVEGMRQEQLQRYAAAGDLYRRAVDEIEFLRAEPLSLERFYDSQQHYEPYERLIRLHLRDGNFPEAFRYMVLSRSKELRQSQDDGVVTARPEALPLVTEERQLRSTIRALAGAAGRSSAASASGTTGQTLGNVVTRWREVAGALAKTYPAYRVFVDPPSLADVQAAIPADTALLAYVAPMDRELSILVVTRDRIQVFASPVAPADLWRQIAELGRQASFKTTWPLLQPDLDLFRKLYHALIAPAASALRGKSRLAVLPTREIHYVPFPALARRVGSGDRFLIEDVEIVNLSGAALSAMQRGPRPARVTKTFTAVADPRANLDAALGEVDAVARLFDSPRVLRQHQATKAALGGALPGTAILHLAAHGRLDVKLPSASHLELAPNSPDGRLTVGDIRSLSLPGVALVTLSACQSSLGQGEPRGLGVSSLSDAFLFAGADSVVGTLWEVADTSTRDLVVDFYRRLTGGACKAAALREAQISLLRRGDVSHPYFWSAFTLFGDWGDLSGNRDCAPPAVR